MEFRDLKQDADRVLSTARQSPRRIALIFGAVALGVPLMLAVIGELLNMTISTGSGLSGMDARAALDTAQVALQIVSIVAMLFWAPGMIFAAFGYIRGEWVNGSYLPEGFRRFGAVLTSTILIGVQYLVRIFASAYLSAILVSLTPFATPVYKLSQMMKENPNLDIFTANVEGLWMFYAATAVVFVLVLGVLVVPVFYRYRMVPYIIMDGNGAGGLRAMLQSRLMMYRRRRKLFRLDLSFWWFYVLEFVLGMLPMAYLLAQWMKIQLPFSDDVAYWILQVVAAALQLGLYVLAKPKLEVTYALCYQAFLEPEPIPVPKPQPPQNHPWNY